MAEERSAVRCLSNSLMFRAGIDSRSAAGCGAFANRHIPGIRLWRVRFRLRIPYADESSRESICTSGWSRALSAGPLPDIGERRRYGRCRAGDSSSSLTHDRETADACSARVALCEADRGQPRMPVAAELHEGCTACNHERTARFARKHNLFAQLN